MGDYGYASFTSDDLTAEYVPQDEPFVQETCDALRAALQSLCEYFALKTPFPPVRVILTPDRPEFDRCVREVLRIEIEVPSKPWRVAQPQRTDLVVLSPRVWEQEFNRYTPEDYRRLIGHEATHIVEEYLSPDIEKVRRWWGEGLATHLSGQWCDSPELAEVCRCVAGHCVPALADIDVASDAHRPLPRQVVKNAYVWGWTLVMFMEDHYGSGAVKRIVTECADGNVFRTMRIDRNEYEREWRTWLGALSARMLKKPSGLKTEIGES